MLAHRKTACFRNAINFHKSSLSSSYGSFCTNAHPSLCLSNESFFNNHSKFIRTTDCINRTFSSSNHKTLSIALREALDYGENKLRNALTFKHVEHDPEGEARMLLFHTLFPKEPVEHLSSRWLSLSLRKDRLTPHQLDTFKSLIARRCQYEPIEYITGRVNFFGRQFLVNKHVLIPRVDSEVMIEAIMKRMNQFLKFSSSSDDQRIQRDGLNIVELGVGSGCLILTLLLELEKANIKVQSAIGLDKSSEALKVAALNAQQLLPPRLCKKLILKEHDMLCDEFKPEEWKSQMNDNDDDSKMCVTCNSTFANTSKRKVGIITEDERNHHYGSTHVLISNPPYIPSQVIMEELDQDVSLHEPHLALDGGPDGLDFYRFLLSEKAMHKYRLLSSSESSLMALELGYDQAPILMKNVLSTTVLANNDEDDDTTNLQISNHEMKQQRFLLGTSKSGSNFEFVVELEKDLNQFDRVLILKTTKRTP
ncbi:hypothetical protein FDP41_003545 [Naegleria fowleri]|uniref:Release factor glutamine methyltransferase N-terminal domain-containing protein n=1 Tax=Naegleria fowleri TaxID=5763 RepID=A0A6A5BI52_NAEFO|nr:uncharacterized protein FDP41_003545 [Naegleria fowleri]KAF0977553.1 hypothetical protein FDP41_003545 [Naegleria fowleri]CAG4718427.1 unnamed protein product [Naegleria fowleri]